MKTGFKVCDAMTTSPIMVSPSTHLEDCAKMMEQNHVGALVVGQNKALQGIITEQDIVRKAVAHSMRMKETPVKLIMEQNVQTIDPATDIFDALMKMRDMNIRHLPVMDNKDMVGLLTLKDVLKIQPQLFELLVEKFELREQGRKPVFGSER